MTPDITKLRALIELLAEQNIAEFEHETETERLRIVRGGVTAATTMGAIPAAPLSQSAPASTASLSYRMPAETTEGVIDITSPFVGTFYRSPSPEAPPFVDVGSVVRPGQTLCIVEAMKLMNEIEAEVAGTIAEVFVQNGKSVEFGQRLFRIKKA